MKAHVQDPNGVVVDLGSRRPEYDNTSICGPFYHVVPDNTIAATNADTIRPLLKSVGPAWSDIIVLDCNGLALQGSFSNMQTCPTSGVERLHIFDELIGVGVPEFDITTPLC